MMLCYHWPPLTTWGREHVARARHDMGNPVRQMDLDEVREALRQNGYTIVRSSRVIPCYGQIAIDQWYHGSDPDYVLAMRRDAANCAAREAAKYAYFSEGPGSMRGTGIIRASLAVINTTPGREQ